MEENRIAVFDFDGTLVSKDTGYEFNKWLIKKSYFRTVIMLVFFPVVGLLISNSHSRLIGLNIACAIATCFQNKSLFRLRNNFVNYYFSSGGAKAYQDGINELIQHQTGESSVLILSGCPKWLLHGVVKYLGIKNVKIIGSECKVSCKSLLLKQHCYKSNKVNMAISSGIDTNTWEFGYTDSKADMAMLNLCKNKILVNVPQHKLALLKSCLNGPVQVREWT